jgi:uncharacterized membrane protein
MNTTFSPRATIRAGWELFKSRAWFFIGAYLLAGVLYMVADSLAASLAPKVAENAPIMASFTALGILSMALSYLINVLYSMGTTAFAIKAHDAVATVTFSDFWHPKPFAQYFITSILVGAVLFAGLILLIVPGIIFGIMFMFATYLVIDKNMAPMDALKESRRMTYGHKWNLFLFGLGLIGINILGFLALIIGLLVSLPVTMLAMAHAYRTLASAPTNA